MVLRNMLGLTLPPMLKSLFLCLLWVLLGSFTSAPPRSAKPSAHKNIAVKKTTNTPAVAPVVVLNNTTTNSALEATLVKSQSLSEKLGLSAAILQKALVGFEKLKAAGKLQNTRLLTIADFSQASHQERLYVINLETETLVQQSLVAHGKNSGTIYAQKFSNKNASNQSSLGFYVTGQPYQGKHGKSLVLAGMEKGINDRAQQRAIVLHGADYVSEESIQRRGYIGRSQGCPAVPEALSASIIDSIQGASCLFIYAPDKNYLRRSALLR